jgi:trimeric autotransporter adhesin
MSRLPNRKLLDAPRGALSLSSQGSTTVITAPQCQRCVDRPRGLHQEVSVRVSSFPIKVACLLVLALCPLRLLSAQPATGVITTLAGTGTSNGNGDGALATAAGVASPSGVAVDGTGNVYIADTSNDRIRKVTVATGIITTVAGTTGGFFGDGGAATSARISNPEGVAVDGAGNIYIADTYNHRIRKVVAATGLIFTVAGSGSYGFGGDGGAATGAQLYYPYGVAVDSAGNLYIADSDNNRVRKVTAATGIITTLAGDGTYGYAGDGAAAFAAQMRGPTAVAVDSAGNVYISDTYNNRIRKVTAATGNITTIAGGGSDYGEGGAATAAELDDPRGVAVDGAGNVYVADYYHHRIRKVTAASGLITTVAGNGDSDFGGDGGAATAAALEYPEGVTVDGAGQLYIADTSSHRIRKVTASNTPALLMTTHAGTGTYGFAGDGGLATAAQLASPTATAVDAAGHVYFTDTANDRIRKINAGTGIITTVAGTYGGYFGDGGAATSAQISAPYGVAVDSAGNIYIADTYNHRIRKVVAATGLIFTVAGSGSSGFGGDGGAATAAQLYYPYGVAVDGAGNLYIADTYNNRVRKVTAATQVITTLAGSGVYGFSGDGAAAFAAQLRNPYGVAVDGAGNVYFADQDNYRIRKVTAATEVITTVAGGGSQFGEGGAATAARLDDPRGVAVDGAGNIYIADRYQQRIRKVTAATGLITTVAGNGTYGFDGDGGVATAATMYYPIGVAVDGEGSLYIADEQNDRIRAAIAPPPPTISTVQPSSGSTAGGLGVVITGTNLSGATVVIGGLAATVTGTTATTVNFTTPPHAAGVVNVTVTTPVGSATKVNAFTYIVLTAPASLSAVATSTTQVQLTWSVVSGAANYEVWRSSHNSAFTLAGTFAGTSTTDSGRAANTTYLYKVRARSGAGASPYTAVELATTIIFQDPVLLGIVATTEHIDELRTAVNAVRAAAGLSAATFTDPTLVAEATPIRLAHITNLRTALDAARSTLALPAVAYGQPSLTAGSVVRATHLTELRAGTQ